MALSFMTDQCVGHDDDEDDDKKNKLKKVIMDDVPLCSIA